MALSSCRVGADRVAVPDLTGQRLDHAWSALDSAGFQHWDAYDAIRDRMIIHRDTWAVLSQTPQPGLKVLRSTRIRLNVGPLTDAETRRRLPAGSAVLTQLPTPPPSSVHSSPAPASSPSDKVKTAEYGLPSDYVPDRGEDAYGRRRHQALRRDMAEYLVVVRRHDSKSADALAALLQAVPPTWCSIWLPSHAPEEYERLISRAMQHGQGVAAKLGVPYAPETTRAQQALLQFARQEAGRRFCPRRVAARTSTPDSVRGSGRLPKIRSGHVNMFSTALGTWYFVNGMLGHDDSIAFTELRGAYLDVMGLPIDLAKSRGWPVELPCGVIQDVLDGSNARQVVDTIRRDNSVSEIHHRSDKIKAARLAAAEYFDAAVQRAVFEGDC